jgi:hypothetical protein
LAAVFKVADRALLLPGVTSVVGEIPAGKTLIVSGAAAVADATPAVTDTLEVLGTLEIFEGATLNASGITVTVGGSSTSYGTLKGTGAVIGDGAVALPYYIDAEDVPEGGITYLSENVTATGKYAASYQTSGGSALGEVDKDGATAILGVEGVTALVVSDVDDVQDIAIPAGKTLTLIGADNKFDAALDLSSAGSLVVKGTLSLDSASSAIAITGNATDANITIAPEGTLALDEYGRIAGKIENNGTIKSKATAAADQKTLVSTPSGSGTVELSGTGAATLDTATLALTQNVVIANGGKLIAPTIATPFSGNKTITVATGGTLDLGTATTLTGATIVNGGTVSTATTTTAALNTILALEGTITSSGAVTGNDAITVPVSTTFTHDTGTFVGGTGTLTIEGTATFTTGVFGDQTGKLTVNGTATFTEATFAKLTSLEVGVDGDATFTAATLDKLTELEVDGDAEFTVNTLAALTTLTVNGTAKFTAAKLDALTTLTVDGDAEFTAATLTALTTLTVNGTAEFTAATLAAALTTLTVDGTAEFTVATLAAVTSLTVGGDLTAEDATFDALTTVTGTGNVTAGAVADAKAKILITSTLKEVSLATTTLTGDLTIPADTTRTFTGDLAPDNTVTVNGIAVIEDGLTLVKALTFGTNGALALVAGAEVTLGDDAAKITGTTYEITAVASSNDGTLTAGEAAVVFTASTISGMNEKKEAAAATLAFGTKDSVLTVKGDTVLEAVTLDVATKGKISVAANQKLTLKYVAGDDDDGKLSGAIFTKAVSGGTAGGAVKANAATPKSSSGAIATSAVLAAAAVEAALTAGVSADGNLGTGDDGSGTALDLEDGVITGTTGTGTSIDTANTFTVGTDGAITVS